MYAFSRGGREELQRAVKLIVSSKMTAPGAGSEGLRL